MSESNTATQSTTTTSVSFPTFIFNDDSKDKINYDNASSINFYDVQTANVLVVGPSGTGKTTFINTLRKPTYTSLVAIDSQTREADMTSNLFELGGQYYMMQVIDTPGFGDSSSESKTDFELEEMILKFVKKGIAHLHLVLVAVRFGVRYDKPQIDSIMNVLRFLGRDMRNNAALLFTNAEKASDEDRRSWISMMEKSEAKNIIRFCEGRAFFTGMCTEHTEVEKAKFVQRLRRDHFQVIHAATTSTPIALHGEEHEKISSQFKVYESAAKDSLTMKKLLPELPELANTFQKLKNELLNYADDYKTVGELFEKLKDVDSDKIKAQCIEWSKFQTAISEYIERGSSLHKHSEEVRKQYRFLSRAIEEFRTIQDEIELFS